MAEFHSLVVSDVHRETSDCVVLTFDIPKDLKNKFEFIHGQHLTIKKEIDGEDIRRSYSLCTSPHEQEWKVAVKQIPEGVFSTFANTSLKPGDILEVMEPSGHFSIDLKPEEARNHIAFAAGSGITPVLSIIKTHLENEPKSTFKLFYVNRTVKSIILKEEIDNLKNSYFNRFEIFHFLTKEQRDIQLLNGRIDKEKLNTLTNTIIDVDDTASCFICGPKDLIELVNEHMQAQGLAKDKIHFELFFSGNASKEVVVENKIDGTKVTIIDGGKEFHFVMDKEYDNLLDGALAAGANLPYACKGGVCSTCRCKVEEGSVEMKVNYALEDYELEKHIVLSCQSVPTSEKIVLNFDV